jgi:hypothetical protein
MINEPNPVGVDAVNISFGCLFEYTKATDVATVVSLIETMEKEGQVSFYRPPRVEEARQNEYIILNESFLDIGEDSKKVYLLIAEAFNRCVTHYKNWIEIKEALYPETFVLVRYLSDDYYDVHYDGPTSTHRSVSSVMYLNEGYEGGHLDFPLQFYTYYPKAGSVLVFPSNYAFEHIANPIKSGVKYAVLAFYHDYDSIIKKDHLELFKVIK